MNRRRFLVSTVAVALTAKPLGALAQGAVSKQGASLFRIGLQKNGVILVARQQQAIEKALGPFGVSVSWHEFQFGPPLLEALNAGAIDFGTTGDAPPIFAQAARANLYYVAAHGGAQNAIIVPEGSAIKSLPDLKGKKIGFGKGSSAHSLLLAALDKAGLAFADITPAYLPPADAAAAFARGSIDAWSIWDPFLAIAEQQQPVRIIANSNDTYPATSYYLANKEFADANPKVLAAVLAELAKATEWTKAHPDDAARLFAEATNVALPAQRKTVERTNFAIWQLDAATISRQQATADRYFKLGLLPKPIRVSEIVWKNVSGS